jgi:gamma-tubulin complex component 5
MTPNTPRLIHLSLASQESIICSLAKTATTVEQLRRFTAAIFSLSISRNTITPAEGRKNYISKKTPTTRTCEAFADAIDHTIRGLNSWCAAREEAMCRAYAGIDEEPVVVSLLHTEKALRDNYAASFDILLDIMQIVFRVAPEDNIDSFGYILERNRQSPAAQTALLLDTLFAAVQQHMERRDSVAGDILMKVFVQTAEPVWGMMGRWLKDGMGLGLGLGNASRGPSSWGEQDDEFFIERSGLGFGMMGLGLLDPEFWSEGYDLREISISSDDPIPIGGKVSDSSPIKKAIPLFLQHIADLVLGTGKAIGLMRALGHVQVSTPSKNGANFPS